MPLFKRNRFCGGFFVASAGPYADRHLTLEIVVAERGVRITRKAREDDLSLIQQG